MKDKWIRKDFSKDSKIKDTLLMELLHHLDMKENEIPEEYEAEIAAAGINPEEQRAIQELQKKR